MRSSCAPQIFPVSVWDPVVTSKLDRLPEYLRDTVDWFMGKARKKEKDSPQSNQDENKLYLEEAVLEQKVSDADLKQIVELPEGLDYNEWLATHTLAFFEHINLIYGTISEFCTMSGCPDMTGPSSRQYLWFDEKGKKCKVAAPQYVDYVMTFTQKTINDESIFPSKFANEFPSSIESIVKKILRLLFHVLAHMYYAHFRELVLLNLHSHLNCIFAHLILFNEQFKQIDEKETEILQDLVLALKLHTDSSKSCLVRRGQGEGDDKEKAAQDESEKENTDLHKEGVASAAVVAAAPSALPPSPSPSSSGPDGSTPLREAVHPPPPSSQQ